MAELPVNNDVDLAQELHNWAVNSMHFIPRGIHSAAKMPTVDDFRHICRGPMSDIWRFIITHVHSAQTVRKIKGNLLLKRLQEKKSVVVKSETADDAAASDLQEQKRMLINELKSTMTSLQLVEADIERLQQEIAKAEQSYQAAVHGIQDVDRKRMLLVAHSKCTAEQLERIEELTDRVRHYVEKIDSLQKKASEAPVMFSRNVSSVEASAGGLETACMKAVRDSCEVIASFLHKLLQGSFEGDESAMNRCKEELWKHVESVTANFPASNILNAVCEYAIQTGAALECKTAAIDICQEAEQLRFKFENEGHLSDLSTPPTVFQSVHQILETSQSAMFSRFVETEKHKNGAWKLQKRLAEASAALDDLLRRQHGNPEALQVARSIVELEMRLASARAGINTLNSVSAEFAEKIAQATAEKETLYSKYQKIQDFKKITDVKQNLIRVLVKQNMNARARLLNQQNENERYVAKSVSGCEDEFRHLTKQLSNCIDVRTGSFTQLHLPMLPTVTLSSGYKMAVAELSIYKLDHMPLVRCQDMISKLLLSLEIPTFVAPEYVMPKIAELQAECSGSALALQRHTTDHGVGIEAHLQQLQKLCEEIKSHDAEQKDRLLPVLQQRLGQATQTLTDCLEIKDVALNWWEQPAQMCAPWVTVDGQNLQQWRDKFTVTATQLRQLP